MSCVEGPGQEGALPSHVPGTSGGCSGEDHLDHGLIPEALDQGSSPGKKLDGRVNLSSVLKVQDTYWKWTKADKNASESMAEITYNL